MKLNKGQSLAAISHPLTGGLYVPERFRYELWLKGELIAWLDDPIYFGLSKQDLQQWKQHKWRKHLDIGGEVANNIPDFTQEVILGVDGTPDKDYPLRILRAYRFNCNCKWVAEPASPVITLMNTHQDERAALLDKAIAILEEHSV